MNSKPLSRLAHRYYQFYRSQPLALGDVVAIRALSIQTNQGGVPALDTLMAGPQSGIAGPFLVIDNVLHEPELLLPEVRDHVISVFTSSDISSLFKSGPTVHWFPGSELFEHYVQEGGVLPGITAVEREFALATALRSVRSVLERWPVHEINGTGYPWLSQLARARVVSYEPASETAHDVRSKFESVARATHQRGQAVVVFDGPVPELDLAGAPLVWIGDQSDAAVIENQLRASFDDVERFGVPQRAADYAFFPERVAEGLAVLLVNSKLGAEISPTPQAVTVPVRKPLRLLIVARPDRKLYPIGGVETLIQQVTTQMQARGATVDIQETATPDARGYDVAHIMGGLAENIVQQGQAVRAAGVPLALTPVFATYEGLRWFVGGSIASHRDPRSSEQDRLMDAMRKRMLTVDELQPAPNATDFRNLSLMRHGYALADNLFICAHGEGREIAVRLGVYRPTTLIPNGVDIEVMRPGIPRVAVVPDRPYVLMTTRIDAQKNLQGLFDAARRIPSIDFVVLGRIDIAAGWEAGTIMSGAPSNLIALPTVPLQTHPWFGSLFANAAAVAVPSWAEVFSLNVLDAAACGVPVFMSHAGFHSELFGELGYYIDPCDADSILEAIEAAISEGEEKKQQRLDLARNVANLYGWPNVGNLLYDAYETMIRRGPVPVRAV